MRTEFTYKGTIKTTYKNIVDKFGEPNGNPGDNKTDFIWNVKIDDMEGSLYDWKSGTYVNHIIGEDELIDWSVNGNDTRFYETVKKFLLNG